MNNISVPVEAVCVSPRLKLSKSPIVVPVMLKSPM